MILTNIILNLWVFILFNNLYRNILYTIIGPLTEFIFFLLMPLLRFFMVLVDFCYFDILLQYKSFTLVFDIILSLYIGIVYQLKIVSAVVLYSWCTIIDAQLCYRRSTNIFKVVESYCNNKNGCKSNPGSIWKLRRSVNLSKKLLLLLFMIHLSKEWPLEMQKYWNSILVN